MEHGHSEKIVKRALPPSSLFLFLPPSVNVVFLSRIELKGVVRIRRIGIQIRRRNNFSTIGNSNSNGNVLQFSFFITNISSRRIVSRFFLRPSTLRILARFTRSRGFLGREKEENSRDGMGRGRTDKEARMVARNFLGETFLFLRFRDETFRYFSGRKTPIG